MRGKIIKGMDFEQYKRLDAVNASFIKQFAKCPASALLSMEPTRNMIIGQAVHALALEGEKAFLDQFVTAPKCDRRTTAGKSQWAEFEAANTDKVLLSQDELAQVQGCAKSLKAHPLAGRMLAETEGRPEVTLTWTDEATGLPMKARLDRLPLPDKRTIIDLKTTTDASLKAFTRQIVKLSYDLQAAVYMNGAAACGIDVDAFVFIAVQNCEPFTVSVLSLDTDWIHWAANEVDRQLALIKECKARSVWPAFEIPQHIYSLDQLTTHDLLEVLEMPKYR